MTLSTHSRPMFLLFMLLVLPGTGFAAPSYRLLNTEAPTLEVEQPWKPHPALRVGTELALGAVGGAGLGLAGGYMSAKLCLGSGRYDGTVERACLLETLTGLWMSSGLGFALGVWGGGSLMQGRGHLLPVLGGLAAGWLVGGGSFLLSNGTITTLTGIALLTPYLFSLLAYELSSAAAWSTPPQPAHARVQPVLGISSQSAVLGLAGSF